MIVVCKRFYYFDSNDKQKFELFLKENNIKKNDFAKKCDISSTLLTLLFNGKRSITKEMAQAFTNHGFKVNVGD